MAAEIISTHINSISRKNPKIVIRKKKINIRTFFYLDPGHL